jgi:hypothetical protein
MSGKFYAAAREGAKAVLKNAPPLFELARRFEEHAKGMVVPGTIFEEFGFNYVGPIDGHDLDSLIPTLENLRAKRGPQFLHVVTKKGYGYKLAEADPVNYHGPGKFDPAWAFPKPRAPKPTFTQVFGQWLCDMAEADERLVASRRPCAKARAWSSSTSAFPSATTTWASPSSMPSPSPPAWPARAEAGGGDLQHLPAARLRPADPRRGAAEPAGGVCAGPRRPGGRRRRHPRRRLRHRLRALHSQHAAC